MLLKLLFISVFFSIFGYGTDSEEERSQVTRKRLIDYYAMKDVYVKTEDFRDTTDNQCEACYKNGTACKVICSGTNKDITKKTCERCYEMIMNPQIGERILILESGERWTIGKITAIKAEADKFDLKILEGSNAGKIQHGVNSSNVMRLVSELIPEEDLCDICKMFSFGEKKCERPICKLVCQECFDPKKCSYCRLLSLFTAVKVKRNKLKTQEKKDELNGFENNFAELYGKIINIYHLPNEEKIINYKVALTNSDGYKWNRKSDNSGWDFELNESNAYIFDALEEEVEVLPPPNTYESQDAIAQLLEEEQTSVNDFNSNDYVNTGSYQNYNQEIRRAMNFGDESQIQYEISDVEMSLSEQLEGTQIMENEEHFEGRYAISRGSEQIQRRENDMSDD